MPSKKDNITDVITKAASQPATIIDCIDVEKVPDPNNFPSNAAKKQEVAVINTYEESGYMTLITQLAKTPTLKNVEVIERMMNVQERWEDRKEEREFSDAIARIVEKLSHIRIIKNKSVGYDIEKGNPAKGQKEVFRYTTIEEIEKIVRPLLIAENITPSYTCTPSAFAGMYDVTCILTRGRHSRKSSIPLPMDTSGGKNSTQGMGSTFKYGQRYALCAALFITTVGEDNDGQGAPITEAQAKEIKDGLAETGLDTKHFLKSLKIDSVDEMPSKHYKRAINLINATKWEQLPEEAKKAAKKKD